MAPTLTFELMTPERVALTGQASEIVVPGLEGAFTVLPGHAALISALRPGMIEVVFADARKASIFVKGGIAEVDGSHLTVLAERALPAEAMDAASIAAELKTAEDELAAATDDPARLAAASAIATLSAMRR